MKMLKFLLLGVIFGVVLIKAEVVSWFRIQEMFHFQAFHMYGVIGSAIAVGMVSILLIRRLNIKNLSGEAISIAPKKFQWGNVIGGFIFGLGWALTGACPGPIYALMGTGLPIFVVILFSAVLGAMTYGAFKSRLPH